MARDIRYVTPTELISLLDGIPMCDSCTEELAGIAYDGDYLCPGCANDLAARGEPVAQYGRPITSGR